MIKNILYLLQVPGLGSGLIKKIIRNNSLLFGDMEFIEYLITKKYKQDIEDIRCKVKSIGYLCCKEGIKIVLNRDTTIPEYPLILYLKGNKTLWYMKNRVALAGTRNPGERGMELARDFSRVLYSIGGILVSGWAKGCDRSAQREILDLGGSTISILPRGITSMDSSLINLGDHLLVSQYPPNYPVRKFCCVRRNRIIAGISKSLYIPEVGEKGGTYHTVEHTLNLGKPIAISIGPKNLPFPVIETKREFDLYIKKSLR